MLGEQRNSEIEPNTGGIIASEMTLFKRQSSILMQHIVYEHSEKTLLHQASPLDHDALRLTGSGLILN